MNATIMTSEIRTPSSMTLGELEACLQGVGARVIGDPELKVTGVYQDSRQVRAGALFVGRSGSSKDGISFWQTASSSGAVALMRETGTPNVAGVPGLEVDDLPLALALAAEAVYGNPTRALELVGITGTNGKTTTAWLTALAIDGAGGHAARLGTLGFYFAGEQLEVGLTTPQADVTSRLAAHALRRGADHLVMEVSSHALSQSRVDALKFAVAAFSNLTQDHLDYHTDMQAYGAAKRRLFRELEPRHRVVNVDDPFGRELLEAGPAIAVSSQRQADIYATDVRMGERGIQAMLHVAGEAIAFSGRLVGSFNLDNLLLAVGIVHALGLPLEPAVRALEASTGVPGRLERCDGSADDVVVLVDYAHTPGALERVLVAAREMAKRELVCVFGCGGDRDPGKRSQMGAIAGKLATRSIVTNDNPRSEPAERIADAIVVGLSSEAASYQIVLDRALAIEKAIVEAAPGDVVVIAGKGHEPYQLLGERVLPFDDRSEARRALGLRRGEGV